MGRRVLLLVLWLLVAVALVAALGLTVGGPLAPQIDTPGGACYCRQHI